MNPSSAAPPSSTPAPPVFEEFFELGQESVSPFLKIDSRKWGANLTLKASIAAAFLLVGSFVLSRFPVTEPLSYILLVLVYFLAGIPSLIESVEELSDFDINIDILMTLAAFSSVFIGSGLEGGLLLVLFAFSGAMEDAVTAKAKTALSSLHKLSPTLATVVQEDGNLIERSVKDISIGTTILIKAGQVVPLDGIVIEGISSVNLVHLTGENLPIRMQEGDTVPAGGRNLEGALTLRVTLTSADSTLSKIINLVTQAQESRPVLQRWFDKLSRGYALTIISLSALFAITLPFFLDIPWRGVEGSIYRAVAFLIAASPCALIIAIPIAYLSAVSACAKKGILLKGGITLDALASCQAVSFDKTGTLTTGNLACEGIEVLEGDGDIDKALGVAYAMEKNAVHPIARAILNYVQSRNIPQVQIKDFKSIPGYGLEATLNTLGQTEPVYIGNPDYILSKLPASQKAVLMDRTAQIQESGRLLAVLLIGKIVYLLSFEDTLRPGIQDTIAALKKRRWDVVMLTGDHEASARRIANEVGIENYHADLKPEDKLRYVTNLSKEKGLAMIGDGINDAPALARATVGICMGKVGSGAAVDAADIVLLHDSIDLLDWLIEQAKKTQTIVRQNVGLAVGAILIASIPALGGFVPLWLAVVMHEGGTVLVGLNALRLLRT
jgi:heavy metal translocating P-type ATPase